MAPTTAAKNRWLIAASRVVGPLAVGTLHYRIRAVRQFKRASEPEVV